MPSPTTPTPEEQATGKLVTDAVAAVIDELRAASTDPNVHSVIDKIAARLATQFHNVPGYVPAEFEARASKTDTERAAELAAKKAAAAKSVAGAGAPAGYDAAAEYKKLQDAQAAAKH